MVRVRVDPKVGPEGALELSTPSTLRFTVVLPSFPSSCSLVPRLLFLSRTSGYFLVPPPPPARIPSLLWGLLYMQLGGQNCYFEEKGAYTGAVSTAMLESMGCEYVLCGHSERRT